MNKGLFCPTKPPCRIAIIIYIIPMFKLYYVSLKMSKLETSLLFYEKVNELKFI